MRAQALSDRVTVDTVGTTCDNLRMSEIQVGDHVVVKLVEPGGGKIRYAGEVRGTVLNAGAELDVIINPAEYSTPEREEDFRTLMYNCGIEDEDWIREGPVMVVRNMQPQDVRRESAWAYSH